ncbi:MAG: hypothetical protein LRY73_02080 [Bacillus sp. (in: Bacteria)]|nr:hypothetical protein [Bacillus sp. (in: firmicutes)]
MVESILQLFLSEQQAQSALSNPFIEFIFMVLFVTFTLAFVAHFILYSKLRRIRSFLQTSNSLDIDPLNRFKREFDEKKATRIGEGRDFRSKEVFQLACCKHTRN